MVQRMPAMAKIVEPISSMGLRPKRSESGPNNTGAIAKPAKNKLSVRAASLSLACSVWAITARAGSPISMDRGGRAPSAPRKSVKPSEFLGMPTRET